MFNRSYRRSLEAIIVSNGYCGGPKSAGTYLIPLLIMAVVLGERSNAEKKARPQEKI